MTRHEDGEPYQDLFEYHGNTTVEHTRRLAGMTVRRDWLVFDTTAEALDFISTRCEGSYVPVSA